MEHPPKPAGSIDLSCLMEFGVYAAQSGDINKGRRGWDAYSWGTTL